MFKKNRFILLSLAFVMFFALFYYAVMIVPAKIKITEIDYKSANYPADYPILRIVAISDVYAGSFHINEQKLEEIVTHINLLKPDIVLLLGNYINSWSVLGNHINPNKISEAFAKIRSTYGTFAVFGKNDIFRKKNEAFLAFKRSNIKTLVNKEFTIDFGQKKSLSIIGIDSSSNPVKTEEIEKIITETETPYILISNKQKNILSLNNDIKNKAIIAFSGNTMGGQVVIPSIKPLFLPKDAIYSYGLHKIGDESNIYVTSGIGTKTYPIRFNTEPEIVFINLYSANIEE